MNIAICAASKGRPAALIGFIMSLWRLRSNLHRITFNIGLDEDDAASNWILDLPRQEATINVAHISPMDVRGCAENAALALARKDGADVCAIMGERMYCITPGWDEVIAQSLEQSGSRVIWWSSPSDNGCVAPIIPAAYLDAIDWKWSPEIFPFWFDDAWHCEICLFLHGVPVMKCPAKYDGQRAETRAGREFEFWHRVFMALRMKRIEQARMIAQKLNIPFNIPTEIMQWCADFDAKSLKNAVEHYPDWFGDKSPPTERYLLAKARAEKYL